MKAGNPTGRAEAALERTQKHRKGSTQSARERAKRSKARGAQQGTTVGARQWKGGVDEVSGKAGDAERDGDTLSEE